MTEFTLGNWVVSLVFIAWPLLIWISPRRARLVLKGDTTEISRARAIAPILFLIGCAFLFFNLHRCSGLYK